MKYNVTYKKLNEENFTESSLDKFIRRQEVFRCWRKINGKYMLTPVHYIEDWNLSELRSLAKTIGNGIADGGAAFGAFDGNGPVGFAYLDGMPFGSRKQYLDLAEFYVSAPYRRLGIGRKLFSLICKEAKERGAEKLYISAHSAEESVKAYKSYGCVPAQEINTVLAEKEPCDLQLECVLK